MTQTYKVIYLCENISLFMLKTAIQRYINNFKGFRREVWILALITFINRAGTMVLPFLSKYLKENLHFTYSEVGWIMVFVWYWFYAWFVVGRQIIRQNRVL